MRPNFHHLSSIALCALSLGTASAAEFFISPEGNDANPGTKAKPFQSLERARDEARHLAQGTQGNRGPITIFLRAGDYYRTNAFELSTADSGTAQHPVIWRAYPKESVRLLGGRVLSGFQPVKQPEVLGRIAEPARTHVLELDLHALGLSHFGELKSRGFARPATPAHAELFFGGSPMTLARWPNAGEFERIAGFPEAGGQKDEHGGKLGKLENGFTYSGDRPKGWAETSEIWVHGYWAWDWANSYERIAKIDPDSRLVNTAAPYGLYGFRQGQRFYFLNILEELDQPGEWFLNHQTGMLYFWPPEPGLARGAQQGLPEVLLSILGEPLLKFSNASYVTFRGVFLEATRASAVEMHGGLSNLIAGCVIRNVGNSGVVIEHGSGHGVTGCDVWDTGDSGISLEGGDRKTLTPAGHFVENCHFARQGRWSKCYVPALMMGGVGMRVSHNLIHDHPHCAILFSGNDHLIEFNEIHHIALETGDVGAIYAGRDYSYRGNRVRYNYIHETGGVGMGSMGVYMDDCVSGTEIFGNVFYKVQRAAFLGGGRDHRVLNNIFVDCNYAVELDGRGLDTSPVWHNMVDKTMRESLFHMPATLYRERYPDLKGLDKYYGPPGGPVVEGADFKGVPPDNNQVARNVCIGKWLNVYWHAKLDWLKLDNNFTNATSAFVASIPLVPKATDFALKSDAPAWQLGFEAIPLNRIGIYRDESRDLLPTISRSH